MMSEEEYQQIRQKLQECFEKKELKQGLKLAVEIKERFPERLNSASFNLAYFHSLLNNVEEMVETLEEAYEKGVWWADASISLFPNYDRLTENNRFLNIVKKFSSRYKKIRENTSYKWIVRTPVNYNSSKKYPILFALHQGDGNIEETEKSWKNVLEHDILLALPQSSEITGENTYTWLDIDNGLIELNEIYSQIKTEYNIDLNNVFLSGFSIGGNLALEATFVRPEFSVKGCIAVNPSFTKPDLISKTFIRARNEGIKCCILAGTKDPDYENIKKLIKLLGQNHIENECYEIKGLGHAFPENFNELLREMITFLLLN